MILPLSIHQTSFIALTKYQVLTSIENRLYDVWIQVVYQTHVFIPKSNRKYKSIWYLLWIKSPGVCKTEIIKHRLKSETCTNVAILSRPTCSKKMRMRTTISYANNILKNGDDMNL